MTNATKLKTDEALGLLFEKFESWADAARACDVSPQLMRKWRTDSKISPNRVLIVEGYTGVSRHDLRPDVFGPHEGNVEAATAAA